MTTTTKIQLRHIRLNGGTQPRAELNEEHIERLKASIQEGEELPPIVCYHDGSEYWLADGFHRVQAHYRCLRIDITAEVRQGTRREAVLYSLSANRTHGLPRTRADTQRAIQTMLADPEWSRYSDREIARTVGCSHATVGTIRAKLESTGQIDQLPARVGGDGKERTARPASPSGPTDPTPCSICGAITGNKVGIHCQDTCYHIIRARELGKTNTGLWHLDMARLGIERVEEPERQEAMRRALVLEQAWDGDVDRAQREELARHVPTTDPNPAPTPAPTPAPSNESRESLQASIEATLAAMLEQLTDEQSRILTYLLTGDIYADDPDSLREGIWHDATERLGQAPLIELLWLGKKL